MLHNLNTQLVTSSDFLTSEHSKLENQFTKLKNDQQGTNSDLNSKINDLRDTLETGIKNLTSELNSKIKIKELAPVMDVTICKTFLED